ncbi:hypothetical protein AMECASPLE_029485 [Ameca splendens]|uniref:Secreted protein n=1 Tax=Ameca splendens TaxID=208324 RepID=A0ABV1AD03_9TELE
MIETLAVCLGLLSCCPCLKSFTTSNRFSSRIALYLTSSLFPYTLTSFPVPAEEKHPDSSKFHYRNGMFREMCIVSFSTHVVLRMQTRFGSISTIFLATPP